MRRFEKRVAVVVGAATGIGAATAKRLAREGARVVVADYALEGADETAHAIMGEGGVAGALGCDIGDSEAVARMFEAAVRMFGGIDAVHINAADTAIAMKDTDVTDVSLEVLRRTIEVNLLGHAYCTRHAVPALLARGGGSLVYTSSRAGLTSERVRVAYAMSKSGIHALMRHTALAWGKQGVRANAVAPGTILTDALLALGRDFVDQRLNATPSKRLGDPEDVAAAVAFLLSEEAAFINGQILSIDGGATMR
jgi:NAD(P)-dependent dehydrogenase (short-subunit alcohol dehydrogenase family)